MPVFGRVRFGETGDHAAVAGERCGIEQRRDVGWWRLEILPGH
jgi:hypothetical protein